MGLPSDHWERNAFIDIELRSTAVRRAIEELFKSNSDLLSCDAYVNLHGAMNVFKCSKPWCDYFHDGFRSEKLRDAHTNQHNLPFQCSVEGCFASKVGFDKDQRLQQHLRRYHGETGDSSTISFPMFRKLADISLTDAVKRGDYDLTKDLLDVGRSPNQYVGQHNSPAYHAADQGNFEMFKLLLERGAKLGSDAFPDFRSHAVHVINTAIRVGSSDIVNLIVSKIPLSDLDLGGLESHSPLLAAATSGSLDILQQLLAKITPATEFNDNLSFTGFSTHRLLPAACGSRIPSVILTKYIIENCSVQLSDQKGWQVALSAAAGNGNCQLVDLLLSVGDTTYRYHVGAALLAAISSGCSEIASTLLSVCDSRIGDFQQLQQILVASCERGMPDTVRLALSCPDTDVNYRDDSRHPTSLLAAVEKGHLEIVDVLLARPEIDTTDCTEGGIPPFLLAMISWSDKIITRREKCVALLRAMRYHGPLHLWSIRSRANVATLVENSLALGDADILDAIEVATGVGDEGHLELMHLWLVPAMKQRQFVTVERLLSKKSVLSNLSNSDWEKLLGELDACKTEPLVRIMLLATIHHYLNSGEGLHFVSMLMELKSPDIARLCIPDAFSATSMGALHPEDRKALVRDIVRLNDSDLLWPMIKSFANLQVGFGDILLWVSVRHVGKNWGAIRVTTIETLVERGLANINVRQCELPKDGVALIGLLPEKDMEGLDGSFTPLHYLIRASAEISTGSLGYYMLNHADVDVNASDGDGGVVKFRALTSGRKTKSALSILLRARGADPNACDSSGISLLEMATQRGNLAAVKLILSTGKCEQRFKDRAITIASTRGYNQILKELQAAPGGSGDTMVEG